MKVKFGDKEVEAIEVQTISSSEPWAECQLADGEPIYQFQTHRVVRLK